MLVWVCESTGSGAVKPMAVFELPSPAPPSSSSEGEAGGVFSLEMEALWLGRPEQAFEGARSVRSVAGWVEPVGAAVLGGVLVDHVGTESEQRLQRGVELRRARRWSQEEVGPRLQLERERRPRRGAGLAYESRRSEQRPELELEPKREPETAAESLEPSSGPAAGLPL